MQYNNNRDFRKTATFNGGASTGYVHGKQSQQLTATPYPEYNSNLQGAAGYSTTTNYPHPQTGYLPTQSYPTMDYSQYGYANPNSSYSYPAYPAQQQQQSQGYQPIKNPFLPDPPARSQAATEEQEIAQWQAAYAPQDQYDGKKGKKGDNPNLTAIGVRSAPAQDNTDTKAKGDNGKKKTVVRSGGGETWEDDTLLEWDPSKFRIYVGNLAGEVTDDSLAKAFAQYDVNKARVVRDKRTTKSKGFGFVEFQDHELGFKAAREMVGKYVGSHPITIQKAKTDIKPTVQKDKKGKHGKGNKNKGGGQKQDDPLRAHTGAHIEKKPVMRPGMKLLG
jgi:hypothetical protein